MPSFTTIIFTPPLILLAAPLFFLAVVTTSLAFMTLFVRAVIVYIELLTSILRAQIASFTRRLAEASSKASFNTRKAGSPLDTNASHSQYFQLSATPSALASPVRTRLQSRRNSNTASYASNTQSPRSGSLTPRGASAIYGMSQSLNLEALSSSNKGCSNTHSQTSWSSSNTLPSFTPYHHQPTTSNTTNNRAYSTTHLAPSTSTISLSRDFEGVGGWRIGGATDGNESEASAEESLWTSMNSRLELAIPLMHSRSHPEMDLSAADKSSTTEKTKGTKGTGRRDRKKSLTAPAALGLGAENILRKRNSHHSDDDGNAHYNEDVEQPTEPKKRRHQRSATDGSVHFGDVNFRDESTSGQSAIHAVGAGVRSADRSPEDLLTGFWAQDRRRGRKSLAQSSEASWMGGGGLGKVGARKQ
ncbi:hypothetical protein MMC25_007597 [Agyrium rufum]|nr:hypothetical protein [Agyrium rufum]